MALDVVVFAKIVLPYACELIILFPSGFYLVRTVRKSHFRLVRK